MPRTDHRRRQARATLLWGLALFAAAQLGGSLMLDYAAPQLSFPSAARVLERLRQQPDTQVVFLGSSRFGGLCPEEMQRLLAATAPPGSGPVGVLNASVPAGDVIASEYVLRKLLRAGARPRLVVLEVMPEYFTHRNEWYGFHVRRQLHWEDLRAHGADFTRAGQAVRFLSARLLGLYVHRSEVRQALVRLASREKRPSAAPPLPLCSGPVNWDLLLSPPRLEVTQQQRDRMLESRAGLQRELRRYRFGGAGVPALERILAQCREQGIEMLLLASPTTRPFREAYPTEVEAAYQDCIARMQKRFGCRFLDCRDWMEDYLFADGHHQNELGSLHFSRLLVHRVLIPWRAGTLPPPLRP